MSCFLKSIRETKISIPNICEHDGIMFYEILIKIGPIKWTVKHRYSDFRELHDKLVEERSVSKDLLPPKKVLGNKSPIFLEKRRHGLEKYLNEVFIYLQLTMPREFVEFIDFHKYDVIFLLQGLANQFYLLSHNLNSNHTFTALELFSISERIKIPCPPPEYCYKQYDFSHILDFCSQLNSLVITSYIEDANSTNDNSDGYFNDSIQLQQSHFYINKRNNLTTIGTSNIVPFHLEFELSAFKELKTLLVKEISTENIYDVGTVRQTLKTLNVHYTEIDGLNKIILCDDIHKDQLNIDDNLKIWTKLTEGNFSTNLIKSIDQTINLLPKLEKLILDNNLIESISNLNKLSFLKELSLCNNKLTECIDLHIEVGNLIELNLSQNSIKSLSGFRRMYSLQNFDISCNLIESVDEVEHISRLPCLEYLRLTGNPVAGSVDYRPRVLSRFGNRAHEVYLDNEKGNQQELDTALVLEALRISQQQSNEKLSTEYINSMYCSIKR